MKLARDEIDCEAHRLWFSTHTGSSSLFASIMLMSTIMGEARKIRMTDHTPPSMYSLFLPMATDAFVFGKSFGFGC
ncbi:hypothetical protein BRADI_4g21005v3 [Brachypodium distachyon]|uniref:Uncharacterized protein n=1 Tax=Brachypodium distachyon TaxID=15368 RepID=A0A0Q3ER36_BRADI|nr:hypothetical protein BRADI_4g21005v3 [Brachypodium distachyon]